MSDALSMLHKLPAAFDPDAAGDVRCTVQFSTSTPAHTVIADGACEVHDGPATNPDVDITMEDDDLVALLKGELNGMTAFMTGKLQIEGDLMLAQRIFSFFDASKIA